MRALLVVASLATASTVHAQVVCEGWALLKQGASIEYTRFNPSHTPLSRMVGTVESSRVEGGKTIAVMRIDNYAGLTNTINNVEKKLATINSNIKVVGQESCTLPGGVAQTCFHSRSNVYSVTSAAKTEIDEDPDKLAARKPVTQVIDQWLVPGVGMSKMISNMMGQAILSMEITKVAGR